MSHLEQEALQRILSGEGGSFEAEDAAEHLLVCDRCRAVAGTLRERLRAESHPKLQERGLLQVVFDLFDRERQSGMDLLTAMAERAEVRRLPNRRSQRDRVRMAKACHTTAFLKILLGELKEQINGEAEFLASLSFLTIEGMHQRQKTTLRASHDLQAEVWTAVANARRRAAEWRRAHQALDNAERHLKEGTGDRRLKAGLLSITASTLADEGHVFQALDVLEKCKVICQGLDDWELLARTLVQAANALAGTEPAKGLAALDQAAPLIPADDFYLLLLAELLRVECLLEVGKPLEALPVYRRCVRLLLQGNPGPRMQIRGKFTGARLLDALGSKQPAERLFDEVVDQDIEHELYKDAYLDLLYLYEHHMKADDLEKAARVCRRALSDPALANVAHEQLQALWMLLLEAVALHPISQELLSGLRQYVNVHWKHPAATPPWVNFR